ncbi:MAG: hypothetical protein V7641_2456 [Blastocatellia bacterium]
MNCSLCLQPIAPGDALNMHHPIYRSNGGIETQPTHTPCHVELHRSRNDFAEWGRIGGQISALSKQWGFNLLNVRSDPAHEINRSFNRAMYAH